MDRLSRKFAGAREVLPRPELRGDGRARVGIIAYGSSDPAIRESQDQLRSGAGLATDYLRVRAWPFSRAVHEFVAAHDRVYVVEQNRDAQLASLLKLDLEPDLVTRLRAVAHVTGLPLDARSVTDEILGKEQHG
jgi:2-oxoglutarate ferredoxin oxidoreductase subunit alpha